MKVDIKYTGTKTMKECLDTFTWQIAEDVEKWVNEHEEDYQAWARAKAIERDEKDICKE